MAQKSTGSKTEKEAGEKVGTILKECLDTCAELAGMNEEKPENN